MKSTKKTLCFLLALLMFLFCGITVFAKEAEKEIKFSEECYKAPLTYAGQSTWYFDFKVNFNDSAKEFFTENNTWSTGGYYDIALIFDEEVDVYSIKTEITGDAVYDCKIYPLSENEPWEYVGGKTVALVQIFVDANRTAKYKESSITFFYGGKKGCTITLINDVPIIDPDEVKSLTENGEDIWLGYEGISSYYYENYNYKTKRNGAYAISEDGFERIKGAEVCIADEVYDPEVDFWESFYVAIDDVKEGQKGINFYSRFGFKYSGSNDVILEEPMFRIGFFDKTPILGTYEVAYFSGYTYDDVREFFGKTGSDVVTYSIIQNYNTVKHRVEVDYRTEDTSEEFAFGFEEKDSPLSDYIIKTDSDILEKGKVYNEETGELSIDWQIDINGTLTITGEGMVVDSTWISGPYVIPGISGAPWCDYYEHINKVVIGEGITAMWGCFEGYKNITKVVLPSTIEFSEGLFADANLKTVGPVGGDYDIEYSWKEKIPAYFFSGYHNIESVVFPENIISIEKCAFFPCNNLTAAYFYSEPPQVYVADYENPSFDAERIILYYIEGMPYWRLPGFAGYYTAIFDPHENDIVYGDVNGDEKINVIDANMARRFAAKLIELDEKQFKAADVNGDGKVNVIDANLIRRFAAKLIDKFPVE